MVYPGTGVVTSPSLCLPHPVGTVLPVLAAFEVLTRSGVLSVQKPCGSCSADIQEPGPCLAETSAHAQAGSLGKWKNSGLLGYESFCFTESTMAGVDLLEETK